MNEQLYNDFITKLLPEIQKGLVITKDYFLDLFSRYITYLRVVDTIGLLVSLAFLIVPPVWMYRKRESIIEHTDGLAFMLLVFLFIPLILVFVAGDNLIKDIFIPEVRIVELFKTIK